MPVTITMPLEGDAEVAMPFATDNRAWLHRAVGRRRPKWDPERKLWLIPRAAARRVYDAATGDGRSARLTRVFRPDTEQCTSRCQGAKPETRDECTCICGGKHHGESSSNWTPVGSDLLVRRGEGGLLTQTITNGIA